MVAAGIKIGPPDQLLIYMQKKQVEIVQKQSPPVLFYAFYISYNSVTTHQYSRIGYPLSIVS